MRYRNRKIIPLLALSLTVILMVSSAALQTSALAVDIPEPEEPGFPLLDDEEPPQPPVGTRTNGLPSNSDIAPHHGGDPSVDRSTLNPGLTTVENHLKISPRNSSSKGNSIQVPASLDGWTTITSEDFEGAFPGPGWSVFDADGTTNGEYYWDDDSYRQHSGSWSAWVANGGADALLPPTDYANNMNSWLVYGPFDLSDAVDAELSFYYWLESEESYDFLGWYASIDNTNYHGSLTSGNSGGWVSQNFDLTAVPTLGDLTGQSSVWIAFIFTSDSSITLEGAYIDDILLRKNTGEPNLAPYTPSGWDYPIVPSSVTGTGTVGTLYTYQNTYIDWSVINNGTANIVGRFYSCLYLDNAELSCWYTDDLGASWWAWISDWILNTTPTPGWHNLKLVADVHNNVPESNESDNSWSMDFYWHPDANLAPYKQGSWDAPVVPSSVTGTYSVNDLYTFQDTYIDWTIKNFGPQDILAQFDTCLYLDNVELYCWYTNGKIAGNIAFIEDWVLNTTPTAGWHNLKIVTDVNDDVEESDETDNTWSNDFYWIPPFPDIHVSQGSLVSRQLPDEVKILNFEISNYGNLSLNWFIHESNSDSCTPADIPWVSISPDSGITSPGSTDPIDMTIDSTGLVVGTYQGFLCINSDDPDESLIIIDITLNTVEDLTIYLPMLLKP